MIFYLTLKHTKNGSFLCDEKIIIKDVLEKF